jgi:hypothetical protein
MDITRFESLGDNCEFGFVMSRHGVAYSSLFRWAITSLPVLCETLRNDFKDLYRLENLEPASPKMLLDRGTGARFHTDMVRNHVFVENYRTVYEQEANKVMHLRKRLQEKLQDPNAIFVYKDRRDPPRQALQTLADLVAERGGARLLYVTAQGALPPGAVEQAGDNLHIARIDRFADYVTANVTSEQVWDTIIETADRQIAPRPAAAGEAPGQAAAR